MFNFFKKKPEYIPHDPCDNLLFQAAITPSKRPEFYKKLSQFNFLVMAEQDQNGEFHCQTNIIDGEKTIYAFTSQSALNEAHRRAKKLVGSNLTMRATNIFTMLAEAKEKTGLILNAQLDVARHFTSDDINFIYGELNLDEKKSSLPKNSSITLGLPQNPPLLLLEQLKMYVENSKTMDDALFGLMSRNNGSSYVCILCPKSAASESEVNNEMKDIYTFVREIKLDLPVDLALVNEQYISAFKAGALMSVLNPVK